MRRKPPRRLVARSGYADILQGYGGVVVRPSFFDQTVFAVPEAAWAVDDIWLSGMLRNVGVGIWLEAGLKQPRTTDADLSDALFRSSMDNQSRAHLDAKAIEYLRQEFGIWESAAEPSA